MIAALSTLHNRTKTSILVAVCGLLAIAAATVGVDDNLPGVLLAFLAATAFVLAFVHPWRTAKKFVLLAPGVGARFRSLHHSEHHSRYCHPGFGNRGCAPGSAAKPRRRCLERHHRDPLPGGLHRWRGRLGCHVHAQPSPANLNGP